MHSILCRIFFLFTRHTQTHTQTNDDTLGPSSQYKWNQRATSMSCTMETTSTKLANSFSVLERDAAGSRAPGRRHNNYPNHSNSSMERCGGTCNLSNLHFYGVNVVIFLLRSYTCLSARLWSGSSALQIIVERLSWQQCCAAAVHFHGSTFSGQSINEFIRRNINATATAYGYCS